MKQKVRSITGNQCRKIYGLKAAIAMTDEGYRAMLQDLFGVESSTDLTFQAARELIEGMEEIAGELGRTGGSRSNPFNDLAGRKGGMATAAQLRKIDAIWEDVSCIEDPTLRAKELRGFVEKTAKVSALRFLDQGGATKVLNGLKAMRKVSTVE